MSDDTEPIDIPVILKGSRWHCTVCGRTGHGGIEQFNRHYTDWHWDYRGDH